MNEPGIQIACLYAEDTLNGSGSYPKRDRVVAGIAGMAGHGFTDIIVLGAYLPPTLPPQAVWNDYFEPLHAACKAIGARLIGGVSAVNFAPLAYEGGDWIAESFDAALMLGSKAWERGGQILTALRIATGNPFAFVDFEYGVGDQYDLAFWIPARTGLFGGGLATQYRGMGYRGTEPDRGVLHRQAFAPLHVADGDQTFFAVTAHALPDSIADAMHLPLSKAPAIVGNYAGITRPHTSYWYATCTPQQFIDQPMVAAVAGVPISGARGKCWGCDNEHFGPVDANIGGVDAAAQWMALGAALPKPVTAPTPTPAAKSVAAGANVAAAASAYIPVGISAATTPKAIAEAAG